MLLVDKILVIYITYKSSIFMATSEYLWNPISPGMRKALRNVSETVG
jgi:hypothetical protein